MVYSDFYAREGHDFQSRRQARKENVGFTPEAIVPYFCGGYKQCVIWFELALSPAAKPICFKPSRRRDARPGLGCRRRIPAQHERSRLCSDQTVRWVEVCYCPTPLQEERPYWEEYFDLTRVQDAHDRRKCRDENGSEPWACGECDCTARLEQNLKASRPAFPGRSLRKEPGPSLTFS